MILLYFIYQLRISQQIQLNGVNKGLNSLKTKSKKVNVYMFIVYTVLVEAQLK